jgi:hypothetical protein
MTRYINITVLVWVMFSTYKESEFIQKLNSFKYEQGKYAKIHIPGAYRSDYKIIYWED